MFINHDMNAFNKDVLNYARADLPLSVWSSDGKSLVKQHSRRIVRVQTKDDVDVIAAQ